MKTLQLSQPDTTSGGWDLSRDANGNLAIASEEASVAQDVASRCKLFQGDLYFDQTQGIPWLQQVLGQPYSKPLLRQILSNAAALVPTVQQVQVDLDDLNGRGVSGSVRVITTEGQTLLAHF